MRIVPVLLFIFLLFLSGCVETREAELKEYYLSLMGESENWKLEGYEIEITKETFMAGNGFLNMKNREKYITDSFSVEVHAVIDNVDTVIQKNGVSGAGVNIAFENTGEIVEDTYLDAKGNPITLEDISNVYVVLEWWDLDQKKKMKEIIDLYKPTGDIT
ncbi:hypothetical protein QGM71_09795 [Virgibacillus sp. C22-A2]|uniref:DUF4825 domain-containing protein n=1 Tax=Virgibacillus tibetensis TaxID=3042313 RepID=A0ABU6KFC9_9BACI|nr:hypothetical protein [Virgibacillus sp. C22-A2]